MASKTLTFPVIAMLDDEFIDTSEIAHIGKVEPYEEFQGKKNQFWFAIMFKGHSNKLFFGSESETIAEMKRAFVVELWNGHQVDEIEMFDEEYARTIAENKDPEGPNYQESDNEE